MAEERRFSASEDTVVGFVDAEGKSHRVDFKDGDVVVKETAANDVKLDVLSRVEGVKEVKGESKAPKEADKAKGKVS